MIPFRAELEALSLPLGQYALFGSAQLAAKDLRPSKDLDIIVKTELWDVLVTRYPLQLMHDPLRIHIGNIEIFRDWMNLTGKIVEMIDSAELLEGIPFVRMGYLLEWKQYMKRPKDLADIAMIERHLKYRTGQ